MTNTTRVSQLVGEWLIPADLSPQFVLWLTRDTGKSPTDNVSSLASISGITSSQASISIYENGNLVLTTTPDGVGNIIFDWDWSLGQHTIQAVQGSTTIEFTFSLIANKSTADYLENLMDLLPTGPGWPKEPTSQMSATLRPFPRTWTRLNGRSLDVISEAFPSTTREILPNWEASLGLTAGSLTLAQRQSAVLAKFIANGGAAKSVFISYANACGYSITITEYPIFRVGISRVGVDPVPPESAAFLWLVSAPTAAQVLIEAPFLANKPAYSNLQFTWT